MKLNLTVGIIGDSGAFGKWLRAFFEKQGLHVIGSSLFSSKMSNTQVVKRSDVVIFAVTLSEMVPVIRSLTSHSRPNQLWIDVGSRKEEIVNAMLESTAEVVGLHPLCAPPRGATLEGETLAYCPARLNQWSSWVKWLLSQLKANVMCCEPAHHDEMMRMTQNVPHAALLAIAKTLMEHGCDREEFLTYSTAASRKVLNLIERMLANSPDVYADIQVGGGGESLAVLDALIDSLGGIRKAVVERDRWAIVKTMGELRAHFVQ